MKSESRCTPDVRIKRSRGGVRDPVKVWAVRVSAVIVSGSGKLCGWLTGSWDLVLRFKVVEVDESVGGRLGEEFGADAGELKSAMLLAKLQSSAKSESGMTDDRRSLILLCFFSCAVFGSLSSTKTSSVAARAAKSAACGSTSSGNVFMLLRTIAVIWYNVACESGVEGV